MGYDYCDSCGGEFRLVDIYVLEDRILCEKCFDKVAGDLLDEAEWRLEQR